MSSLIRIGTRDSELALWQAQQVERQLGQLGINAVLCPVKSMGDIVLDKPLYELGVTGIFTKTLDIALLKGNIDIAVHSMKDVPTQLPDGVVQTAVLERASTADVLLHKGIGFLNGTTGTIATGSLRRRAQWLNRYPEHQVVDLRGNVNTRMIKLIENDWNGAIFAKAGLERIKLLPQDALVLDWMIPAPAQGAMVVVALESNQKAVECSKQLNHKESALATYIEREFLRTLEGGCTAPIGALAEIEEDRISFRGCLHSLDGREMVAVSETVPINEWEGIGKRFANQMLDDGGSVLMKMIMDERNNPIH
ncbi:MAG: hydroxymethylbilane synthase [Bacteroidota bacterium]